MNLNKAFIIGNLTRDPEVRTLPSGQSVATFSVASNRMWTDKQGQKQKQAEFHNIVTFGRLAEIAGQYLTKGAMVFIEGRIQTRSWDGQDGAKKWRTEIVAESMQMGPRGQGGGSSDEGRSAGGAPVGKQDDQEIGTIEYPGDDEINPNDIPF